MLQARLGWPTGVNCLFSLGPQLCLFSHLNQRPIAHTLGATQDSSLCLVDWHRMAHETWHRCKALLGGGRSGVQRRAESKHQPASHQEEDIAFSLGYPSCTRPTLSRPLSVNLSIGPQNFTPLLPTFAVVGSQTYKQLGATHGGPCQESGNIVVMSTIPPLLFRWAGSFFVFPRSQSASCPVSQCSITHLPSSTLSPNEPSLFSGVFWALSIAFWANVWAREGS